MFQLGYFHVFLSGGAPLPLSVEGSSAVSQYNWIPASMLGTSSWSEWMQGCVSRHPSWSANYSLNLPTWREQRPFYFVSTTHGTGGVVSPNLTAYCSQC